HVQHPPQLHALSLHDALPISSRTRPTTRSAPSTPSSTAPCSTYSWTTTRPAPHTCALCTGCASPAAMCTSWRSPMRSRVSVRVRSEEHTSELQSRENLVCRLL